jgi:outer membrane protein W
MMSRFKSKKISFAIAIALVFLALQFGSATDASAQDEYSWIGRGYYLHNYPGSDTLNVENPEGFEPPIMTQFWADGGNGFGGEVEYMFRPNVGLWGGVAFSNIKTSLRYEQGDIGLTGTDRVDLRQFSLGGNYHFTPDRRFDIYAGVLASWVNFSSSTFNFSEVDRDYQVKYDNELSGGLNLGIDFPFSDGSPWLLSGGLRYMFLALEGDANVYHITIDPLQLFIGVGYRW